MWITSHARAPVRPRMPSHPMPVAGPRTVQRLGEQALLLLRRHVVHRRIILGHQRFDVGAHLRRRQRRGNPCCLDRSGTRHARGRSRQHPARLGRLRSGSAGLRVKRGMTAVGGGRAPCARQYTPSKQEHARASSGVSGVGASGASPVPCLRLPGVRCCAMRLRRFGNTDLEVSPICFGPMRFAAKDGTDDDASAAGDAPWSARWSVA